MEIVLEVPNDCLDLAQRAEFFCLPVRRECYPTVREALIVNCGEEWNCIRQCAGDEQYYLKFTVDDTLYLQTHLRPYVDTPSSPATLDRYVVKIIDHLGTETTLSTGIDGKLVGWNDRFVYQNWQFNLGTLFTAGYKCFQLKFQSLDAANTVQQEFCSQWFKIEDCWTDNSLLIHSTYPALDCFNNYYGAATAFVSSTGSDFQHTNKIRLQADFKYQGYDTEPIAIERIVTKTELRNYYRLQITEKVPPFLVKYLGMIMSGSNIYVDGDLYLRDAGGRVEPRPRNNMFIPQIELYKYCDNDLSCS